MQKTSRFSYNLNNILNILEKLKDKNVLIIGDTIIDDYVFVSPKGRAIKDPILSVEYINQELYAGGVLAVVNHISTFVNKVELITLLGDKDNKLDFISNSLDKKVLLKTFTKIDSPTTIKKRYIDAYKNNKLFKIEYINDKPISKELSNEITKYLLEIIPNYDIVLVADFGHGFINSEIRKIIEQKSRFLAINVQSNSANMGYNYVNLYKKFDFVTMNDAEIRMPLMMRFEPMEQVIKEFNKKFNYNKYLVTLGKKGSAYFNNNKITYSSTVTNKIVDTVGAGDALFAISSLFVYAGADDEIVPFIANCAGGLKASYIGNKECVTKEKLLKFIDNLYKNELE